MIFEMAQQQPLDKPAIVKLRDRMQLDASIDDKGPALVGAADDRNTTDVNFHMTSMEEEGEEEEQEDDEEESLDVEDEPWWDHVMD